MTTSRGREPGNYAMVAFGGAGGLFATEVADFLGITTIISPPDPGNLCAFGLHVSDVRRDYIRTMVRRQSPADGGEIIAAWNALAEAGRRRHRWRRASRAEKIAIHRVADVRYFGEGHEVQVDIPAELGDAAAIAHMWKEFHRVHDRTFGFHYEGEQDVELVNLRIQAVGVQHRPALKPDTAARAPAKPFATRPGLLAADRLDRVPALPPHGDRLRPGDRRAGDRRGIRLDRRRADGLDAAAPTRYGNLILEKSGLRPIDAGPSKRTRPSSARSSSR